MRGPKSEMQLILGGVLNSFLQSVGVKYLHNPERAKNGAPLQTWDGGSSLARSEESAPGSRVVQVTARGFNSRERRECNRGESALERQEALLTTRSAANPYVFCLDALSSIGPKLFSSRRQEANP